MTQSGKKQGPRSIETQIEIAAPVEAVWKALTETDELIRWFPLEARVTPGPGGSIWTSWKELRDCGAESRIEIWEPSRRLRTIEVTPLGGTPQTAEDAARSTARILDYFLETREGKTVLRLVHSGFGNGSDWEDELYYAFRRGWQFELRGLRHYLERHRGQPRAVAWARETFPYSSEEAWNRLMGPRGILREGSLEGLREGDRYSFLAANGDGFKGIIEVHEPQRQFTGTVENMNDALLRVKVEPLSGRGDATVWLSTYGIAQDEVDSFQRRWNELLRQLLR